MSITGTAVVAAEWTLVTVSLAFLVLRGYVRYLRRQTLGLSDLFVFLGWLSFVSCCACDIRLNELGLFDDGRTYQEKLTTINADPAKTTEALKLIYGSALPYYTGLWLIKAALLAFYYEFIPSSHRFVYIALQIVAFFTTATYIMVICLNAFFCQPISSNWSLSTQNQCINSPALAVFFPSVISNIIADLFIFILPFFLFKNLHISRRQLWGLISVFGLGAIAILMSVARIIALAVSATTTQVAVWTALECSIGIIVACCPALRVLLRRPGDSGQESTATPHISRVRTGHGTERNEANEFPLVDTKGKIYKSVDFEIGSDRGSTMGTGMGAGGMYTGRVENWETPGGKGVI